MNWKIRVFLTVKRWAQEVFDLVIAAWAFIAIGVVRLVPEKIAKAIACFLTREIGMRMPRNRVGLENLRRAFPEKSEAERRAILVEAWENLGRTVVEYAHLESIWDFDTATMTGSRVEVVGIDRFVQLKDDGKPAIIVASHLANWELPMVCAAAHGLDAAALFRAPNNRWLAAWVLNRRKVAMGDLIASKRGSVLALSAVLDKGKHLGLLVDQHFFHGTKATFFGRPVECNPTFARLARNHECPVHGVRVIRLAGDRFRVELTEELILPRAADGRVDIGGSVQLVNDMIEGWVRENPGQWLWQHRRWRGE